ncbi:MAG: type II toxin-antitoxin system prevent-host-death family antitoxin [bacterium]|nr:type II toxin-antitoxin system prevent-host-death family antitoxin [bacterium]MCY4273270.1 type II toxin-antitoxin system prevent-host-death family antitoxin [bacterium]
MDVGVRELKAKLSEYIGRAAAGEVVIVTDRGRPVAQLAPLAGFSAVARGIEEGWIEPPKRAGLAPIERFVARQSVLDVLHEDRG